MPLFHWVVQVLNIVDKITESILLRFIFQKLCNAGNFMRDSGKFGFIVHTMEQISSGIASSKCNSVRRAAVH